MKKKDLWMLFVLMMMLVWAIPSQAWQGRMAGVGDAAGLIEDESDYLTHPSLIASGKGFNAYGSYRLTYDKTSQWDYTASSLLVGVTYPYVASGYAWKNEAQLGAAFQLGPGRMGLFFDYTGTRGKYSGDESYMGFMGPNYHMFDLEDTLNNFALKAIYGMPLGPVNAGAEIQIAYRSEEQETMIDLTSRNYLWAAEDSPALNLYPYMIPFDSKYWEAQAKVSVGGSAGPAKYAVTLKGGLPFASENEYAGIFSSMKGNVKGFNVGGEAWIRMPLSNRVTLPFVVAAGYKKLTRDGSQTTSWVTSHENELTAFNLKIGGGADFTPAEGTKMAAGIYYDYVQTRQKMSVSDVGGSDEYYFDEYTDMPNYKEHRLTIRALAEQKLSSMATLRGGVNVFYGIVKSDYAYSAYDDEGPYAPMNMSTSGSVAGVNASVGASFRLAPVTLEPFLNAGYMKYRTSGDGTYGPYPAEAEFNRTNWLVGGGLSVRF